MRRIAMFAAGIGLVSAAAVADYEAFVFSGTVSEIVYSEPGPERGFVPLADLGLEFQIGEGCTGTMIVQSSVENTESSLNVGGYEGAMAWVSASIGGYTLDGAAGVSSIRYSNDNFSGPFFGDHVTCGASMTGAPVDGAVPEYGLIRLSDSDGTVFPTNAETKTLWPFPLFEEFEFAELEITFVVPGGIEGTMLVGWVRVALDSLAPAPECVGDLDGDFDTDVFDFNIFAPDFGCDEEPGDLVTVEFRGFLTEIDGSGGVDVGSEFFLGEGISGTVTYDMTTANTLPLANVGMFEGAVVGASLTVGDYSATWAAESNSVRVANNSGTSIGGITFHGDTLDVQGVGLSGDPVDGVPPWTFGFSVGDFDNEMFATNADTDTLMPPPDLDLIDVTDFYMYFQSPALRGGGGGPSGVLVGVLASVRVVPSGGCAGDLDGDGDTDVFDFNLFAPEFGCGSE